ncbi:MAG: phosphatidylserine/phosphatidylglycerophosphate/cardiolipin synthase family protein [Wenzhouxiangella sp.]|nr:MAG: phosphatidylserine/phosphatidylglycerophosphate/cardiolipin synthase family protein [Wenzhouxiangella sp.]
MNAGGRWLASGADGILAMLAAIEQARYSLQLQTYIYRDDDTGRLILAALEKAAQRGVRVRVLVDDLGSYALAEEFFARLTALGGTVRRFNPVHLLRLSYRGHRKALICDRELAVVGGFNIGEEYNGDGIERGWRDLGLVVRGLVAEELALAFDRLFVAAGQGPRRFARLWPARERRQLGQHACELLLGGPGAGRNPLKKRLYADLTKAGTIRVVSPYFLPTWPMRRRLMRLARAGGQVQLVLPGKSDVALARHASCALYSRLLRAGVEIHEYQPQVLHAKMVLTDRSVLVGSANFNTRSLHIDYELMVRLRDADAIAWAGSYVDSLLSQSRRIDPEQWRRSRSLLDRLRQRFAYWVMARLDPLLAGWLWRRRHQRR